MITVDDINKVNDSFIDVLYTGADNLKDVVSIHINCWERKLLDGYDILSKRHGYGVNRDIDIIMGLQRELSRKGYKLI